MEGVSESDIEIPPPKNVTRKKRTVTKKRMRWLEEFIEAME